MSVFILSMSSLWLLTFTANMFKFLPFCSKVQETLQRQHHLRGCFVKLIDHQDTAEEHGLHLNWINLDNPEMARGNSCGSHVQFTEAGDNGWSVLQLCHFRNYFLTYFEHSCMQNCAKTNSGLMLVGLPQPSAKQTPSTFHQDTSGESSKETTPFRRLGTRVKDPTVVSRWSWIYSPQVHPCWLQQNAASMSIDWSRPFTWLMSLNVHVQLLITG